jgi:ABC-2 type transport system ATP-binding protein
MQEVRKYQIAFDRTVAPEELGFAYMSYSQKGRVAYVVAKGDSEEIKEKILALNPLFVEELDVDFEELFIGEVESRGYLK